MASPPKLLDRVRTAIRTRHYSRRTEEAYVGWIRRFILFHQKRHPSEMGASEIGMYLSWLAESQHVSASTQNQALSAVMFLYRDVLGIDVGRITGVPAAKVPRRLPVVLTPAEVSRLLQELTDPFWSIAALLFGAGLRLNECLELRVKDLAFERSQITVRRGKGGKDRVTMLPRTVQGRLLEHLERVRVMHSRDLKSGFGRVMLPEALARKYFDLVGAGAENRLDYIEVMVQTKYPSNCFWSARTAVSQLLDSMMRTMWLPLTIRRLDLYLEGDERPLCQQLILPFTDGVRWGPLGGVHQYPFLAPYEALVREAITTGSPYYRLLCAYRLYEGVQPLRKMLRDLGERAGVAVSLPKPQPLDLDWLRRFGIQDEYLAGLKNVEDFWQKTGKLRHAAAHFLLDDAKSPVSFSDGPTYYTYSLAGALLLHYSHAAFLEVSRSIPIELSNKLQRGSILPMPERKRDFALRPDPKAG